jgi:membrane protein implicated in regulation of membrane protease activity
MGIGGGIFLIVAGAILTFAVNAQVSGVDLDLVGIIMMVAGVVTLIVALVMNAQRTHTSHREVVERYEGRPGEVPPRV